MPSCLAQDVLRYAPRPPTQRTIGTGIGEVPFFLDAPATVDLEEIAERERLFEELDRETLP